MSIKGTITKTDPILGGYGKGSQQKAALKINKG